MLASKICSQIRTKIVQDRSTMIGMSIKLCAAKFKRVPSNLLES